MGLDIIPGKGEFNGRAAPDMFVKIEGPDGAFKYQRLNISKEDRMLLMQYASSDYEALDGTGARAYDLDSLQDQISGSQIGELLSDKFYKEIERAKTATSSFAVDKIMDGFAPRT